MSNVPQSFANITAELQYQDFLRIMIVSTLTTFPCCVFLFINGTMLFTLRSKLVFRETCRYILLYNLLFADTLHLAQSQLQYLLFVCRIKLSYPLCGFLGLLVNLTGGIAPLTLVMMSLERYVAVCYPLRHATIVTIKNTEAAVIGIWAISSLNNLTRLLLFLEIFIQKVDILLMKDVCSNIAILLGSKSDQYDTAFTCILFLSAGVAVISSYIGVIAAARSASTDKTLAGKARNTLLLNLTQLCLNLSSAMYFPLIIALSRTVTRTVLLWVQSIFYVCFIILPRCLSSLIYGLRDETIRPVLMFYLLGRANPSIKQARNLE
ncbi:odorant receptor 131-2-like [Pelmatolapia mariae]|uniref:odorant receptor 131-2-like n=1 Tax=Pelmatolapia mariae TaxID=158779 RepID=UPI002FE6BA80